MTIAEQAQAADTAQRAAVRASQDENRRKSLAKVRDNWSERYGGFGQFEPVPPCPDEDAFTFVRGVRTDENGRNAATVSGWRVEVDGIAFLRVTDYGSEQWRVYVTCPDCGQELAVGFHGPADLGTRLRTQRGILPHRCKEAESREVAYAIGSACRDAKTDPDTIIGLAFERHADLIDRLRFGR